MENNISDIELWLDDYRQGKISGAMLKQNMEQAGIEDYSKLEEEHTAAINIIQRCNVLQQVAAVHEIHIAAQKSGEGSKSKMVSINAFRPFLKIAAMLIFVIAAAAIFLVATTSQSSLYGELSEDYHVETNRAENTQQISKIVKAFDTKDFNTVINEFETLSKPAARELFLGGYAYLQTGSYDNAISAFKKAIIKNKQTGERLYQDEAEYYLILALIKNNNYKEAHKYAENIYNDRYHTYHDKITRWLLLKLSWLG
jgi:tetratricopeptide (TPR) repeat protein